MKVRSSYAPGLVFLALTLLGEIGCVDSPSTSHSIDWCDPGEIQFQRFTSCPASEFGPAWSPNGRRIAYSSDEGGDFDIWIKPVAGGEAIRRTDNPENEYSPTWSPNGRNIAFHSFSAAPARESTIWILGADRGSPRMLTLGMEPSWSPDAGSLAFQTTGVENRRIGVISVGGRSDAIVLDGIGLPAYDPQWSPDGASIAYSAADQSGEPGASDIWIVPATGGKPYRLTDEGTDVALEPAWSPDGRFVAYTRSKFPPEIRITSVEDGCTFNLTQDLGATRTGRAAFSPDGRSIAFSADRDIWIASIPERRVDYPYSP